MCRTLIPFPHSGFHNPEARKYDRMSVLDRLNEISQSLTPNERASLESFILLCSCGTLETTSLFEFLHWWALGGYTYQGCMDCLISYKFKGGQSSFAIKFFNEALATGNLSYALNSPVKSIHDEGRQVTLKTRGGRKYTASRLVSTIPLNVLSDVEFNPPLDQNRAQATKIGHVNQCVKVHAEISNKDMRSWTGITYPSNKLTYAIGDGTTPAGNTHVVCFGGYFNHIQPEEDIDATKSAVTGMAPGKMDIQRLVSLSPAAYFPRKQLTIGTKRFFTIGLRTSLLREHGFSRLRDCSPILLTLFANVTETYFLPILTGQLAGEASSMEPLKRAPGQLLL